MAPLSERELVHCKLSGMITEADWKSWTPEQLIPYMEIALELFGPDRLMYGSDWPVCLLAGEYERFWQVIEEFTDHFLHLKKRESWAKLPGSFIRFENPQCCYGDK
ncbi:amidohydrolase family protein [Algoriphagus boritolerans]|uniref:amidohydrolase family protein n=1 Tax=Algoriphagus boritolerans TaxID=308111 RepID=UPI000A956340